MRRVLFLASVMAALPELDPQDLEITCTQNTLTLSGTVPNVADSDQGKNATWYAHEPWSGQFQRTVTLPFEVDADKAEATFENGLVRIAVPKAERAKPQKIAIKAGSGQQEAIGAESSSESQSFLIQNGERNAAGVIPGRSSWAMSSFFSSAAWSGERRSRCRAQRLLLLPSLGTVDHGRCGDVTFWTAPSSLL